MVGDAQAYTAVTFSPDRSRPAAAGGLASEGSDVTIWDTVTGEELVTFHNDSEVIRLAYDLGGGRIFTFDWSGFATSWDAVTGEKFPRGPDSATRRVYDTAIWDAEFTQDGQMWAAAGFDGFAHVYQANSDPNDEPSYSKIFTPGGHTGNVTGTAFNADGSILVTSSFDGTVILWDMSDGQQLLKLTDQPQSLGGVDFSPDGRTVATAGADGMVRFFHHAN